MRRLSIVQGDYDAGRQKAYGTFRQYVTAHQRFAAKVSRVSLLPFLIVLNAAALDPRQCLVRVGCVSS